jgi:hypothetical protein
MDDHCNSISALTAKVPNEEFDRRERELQQTPLTHWNGTTFKPEQT